MPLSRLKNSFAKAAASRSAHRLRGWGALMVVVLGVELTLRLTCSEKLVLRRYPLVYLPDRELGYKYAPNAWGRLRIPFTSTMFQVNQGGYLGQFFPAARSNAPRVAIFDSSNGTGIWLNEGRPYPQLLLERLAKRTCPIEVLNFSVDGRLRSLETVKLAVTRSAEYLPDLVLVHITVPLITVDAQRQVYGSYVLGYSSLLPNGEDLAKAAIDSLETKGLWNALHQSLYSVRAVVRYSMNNLPGLALNSQLKAFVTGYWETPLAPRALSLGETNDHLAALQKSTKQLVLLTTTGSTILNDFAKARGFESWDLELPRGDLGQEDNSHWNASVHRAVADGLANKIERLYPCVPSNEGGATLYD